AVDLLSGFASLSQALLQMFPLAHQVPLPVTDHATVGVGKAMLFVEREPTTVQRAEQRATAFSAKIKREEMVRHRKCLRQFAGRVSKSRAVRSPDRAGDGPAIPKTGRGDVNQNRQMVNAFALS